LHHFLQCIEHVTGTHDLLAILGITDPDAETAMQMIVQKSALQLAPLVEFLTKWPVPHFEREDAAR
jgi:hypothetical protein